MSEHEFISTQKLIEILKIMQGEKISISKVKQINKGEVRLLIGSVIARKYTGSCDILTQVVLRTQSQGIITLVDNPDVAIINLECIVIDEEQGLIKYQPKKGENIFSLLGCATQIQEPQERFICNLSSFEEKFQEAENHGFQVAVIYSLTCGEIIYLSILSKENRIVQTIASVRSGIPCESCHPNDDDCLRNCI